MLKKLVFSLVLVFIAGSVFAGNLYCRGHENRKGERCISANWELAYEHDGYGVKTYGDIDVLISAIKNGADVKVILHSSVSGDSSFKLDKVNVSLTNIVYGLRPELEPNTPATSDTTLHPRLFTFSTTGETSIKFYNASDLNVSLNYPLSWYVSR
jgi:hypothetical protein